MNTPATTTTNDILTSGSNQTYGKCELAKVNYPTFDKYSPTKTFSMPLQTTTDTKWLPGDSLKNNEGTRLVEDKLGVKWKAKFIYAGSEYQQKLSLMMVSGDVPDFFEVTPLTNYAKLVEAGLLKDLTDIWPKAASEHVQNLLAWNKDALWKPITIKGRFYGWPRVKVLGQDEMMMWYRKDWLKKIGAKSPTTLNELHDVAKAMVDAKLAPKGAPTIGFPIPKTVITWLASADPVFGAYGVMPGEWKQMPDGKLESYSIQPGAKEALSLLAQWYKEGLIQQDFYTMDENKVAELIINGQVGIFFGPFWCAGWPLTDATKNAIGKEDPGELWEHTTIPTGPNGQRGTAYTSPVVGAVALNHKLSDEDATAIIKNFSWNDNLTHFHYLWQTQWHGLKGYDYIYDVNKCVCKAGPGNSPGLPPTTKVPDVLFRKHEYEWDDFLLNKYKQHPDQLDCMWTQDAKGLLNESGGNRMQRAAYAQALKITNTYAIKDAFTGIPGPAYTSKGGVLSDTQNTWYVNLITGREPMGAFDQFVKEWKSKGGDEVTKEINDKAAES